MGLKLPPVDTVRTRRQQSANTFFLLFDGLLRHISRFVHELPGELLSLPNAQVVVTGERGRSLLDATLQLPTRIDEMFPIRPKTLNSQIITATITTTFKIFFMVVCIGM